MEEVTLTERLLFWVAFLGTYGLLVGLETIRPGRPMPPVQGWKLRGLLSFLATGITTVYMPRVWNHYLAEYRLFDLTGLSLAAQASIGLLVYEFIVFYAWHRAIHESDFLWRIFHQMHHSAERIDSYGAFYFHPMDMIGWAFTGSIALTLVLGLEPRAVMIIGLVANLVSVFQHTNIRTPRWLGYFVQRPESHTVHHAKGAHAGNYCDLPIFDILFGTFVNPQNFVNDTGFYMGASERVRDMLLFKDVSQPAPAARERTEERLPMPVASDEVRS